MISFLAAALLTSSPVFPNRGPDRVFRYAGRLVTKGQTSGSAVAIGREWVLTAKHVDGEAFELPGLGTFRKSPKPNSNLVHPSADLRLFRVDRRLPGYYRLGGNAMGKTVTIVGNGSTGPAAAVGWQPDPNPGEARRAVRNVIEARERGVYAYDLDAPGGGKGTLGRSPAVSGEGGMASWDSGGGWFLTGSGAPRLVAIGSAAGHHPQSEGPGRYDPGDIGIGVDLSVPEVRKWIGQHVPEAR